MDSFAAYWQLLVTFDLIGGVILGTLLIHTNRRNAYGLINGLEGAAAFAFAIPYSWALVAFTPMSIISAIWLAIFK